MSKIDLKEIALQSVGVSFLIACLPSWMVVMPIVNHYFYFGLTYRECYVLTYFICLPLFFAWRVRGEWRELARIERRNKTEPKFSQPKAEPAKPQTAAQFERQQFLSAMNRLMPKEQARPEPEPQRKTNYSYDYATRMAESAEFYRSPAWRSLRAKALHLWGSAPCACCNEPFNGRVKHVDHIKPRSKYPHLALKLSNLQVMCEDCNLGKSNHFEIDWRTPAQKRAFGAF